MDMKNNIKASSWTNGSFTINWSSDDSDMVMITDHRLEEEPTITMAGGHFENILSGIVAAYHQGYFDGLAKASIMLKKV